MRQCVLPGPSAEDLPAWEPSPEQPTVTAGAYLTSNSIPAASIQAHGCFGLEVPGRLQGLATAR